MLGACGGCYTAGGISSGRGSSREGGVVCTVLRRHDLPASRRERGACPETPGRRGRIPRGTDLLRPARLQLRLLRRSPRRRPPPPRRLRAGPRRLRRLSVRLVRRDALPLLPRRLRRPQKRARTLGSLEPSCPGVLGLFGERAGG